MTVPSFVQDAQGRWHTVWGKTKDAVKTAVDRPVGDHSQFVAQFQRFANDLGVRLAVTGLSDWKTRRFCRMFQDSFSLGPYWSAPLTVDGDPGVKTLDAVALCRANEFRVSTHFEYDEFRTGGDQTVTTDNHVILVTRAGVHGLEALRSILIRDGQTSDEAGIGLESAYRSKSHNAYVNGKVLSKHLKGLAFDFDRRYLITEAQMVEAGFTAFGFVSRVVRVVVHGDMRRISWRQFVRWFYT